MRNTFKAPVLLLLFFSISITTITAQSNNDFLLKDQITLLENNFQVTFLFDSDLLKKVKTNLDISSLSLEEALDKLSKNTAFTFSQSGSNIIVKPKQAGCNLKICGTLLDTETKESIPGASVVVGKHATYSDENGSFTTYSNLTDTSKIQFYSFGYEAEKISPDFFNGKDCQNLLLKPSTFTHEEISIIAYLSSGINYRFKDHSLEFKPKGMGLLPGETDADILMTLDALPGISTPDSKAGNLNIRGSTPDQTLVVFDDIPIYHKGHYFGTLSPYNASIVEDVKVQRSAYMADKGGRVGGVIEINSKKSIPDSIMNGVSLSTTYASAYTHIPVIKNKLALLLAGRTSYPSRWISPKMETINQFIYQESSVMAAMKGLDMDLTARDYNVNDVNAKIIARPGKKDELSISFLRISNFINIGIVNKPQASDNTDKITLNNIGGNISWARKWNNNFTSRFSATNSTYSQNFTSLSVIRPDSIIKDATFKNQINDLSFKWTNDLVLTEKSSINFGYDFHYQHQGYLNSTYIAGKVPIDINKSIPAYLHSGFATYILNTKKYMINAGLRANYYTPTNKWYPEPRIIANYFVNKHFTLKSSAGVFNQYIMQVYGVAIQSVGRIDNLLWLLADGKQVPVLKSKQGMFGGIYQKNSWIFDLEMYYKTTNGLAVSNIVNPSSPNPYLYGSGNTIGADVLVKKSWKNLDAWISYTLSKSMLDYDSIQKDQFPSMFDQRHIFDIVGTYKVKQWKFSLGWKYRSGLAALPTIRARYLQGLNPPPLSGSGSATPPPGPPPSGPKTYLPGSAERYTDRFPAYHQLDVSIVYALPTKKKQWNSTIGLSIFNVYNKKNIIDQHNRKMPNGDMWVSRFSMGISPNLVFSINW